MTTQKVKTSLQFAQQALEEENPDLALGHFQAAAKLDPQNVEALIGQARILARQQRLGDAEDLYIQAVEVDAGQVQTWIELVELEFGGGADEVARENLAAALRLHPGHPELLRLRGDFVEENTDSPQQKLVDDIRQALFEQAIARANMLLTELENRDPDGPLPIIAAAEIFLAGGEGRSSKHIHKLTKLTREDKNNWQALTVLGRLFAHKGPMRNPRMAAGLCEDAWRISGEQTKAGLGLVEAWSCLGKHVHAHALCKRLAQGQGLDAQIAQQWLAVLDA